MPEHLIVAIVPTARITAVSTIAAVPKIPSASAAATAAAGVLRRVQKQFDVAMLHILRKYECGQ